MAVLVLNDSVGGLVEAATYCKANDEKRPSLVGLPDFTTTVLCPEDPSESQPIATDASPDTFYVRIMFDELLDPTVEDLIPILDDQGLETGSFTGTIANTKPVTLRCTGVDGQLHDMNYDGYYSPSGNAVTWPVGPSLVIKQIGDVIVPTNADCEVTLKDFVKDKQGIAVPADQRGPFKFKVSGVKPLVVDPAGTADDPTLVDANAIYGDNFYLQLNAEIQGASGAGQTAWCTQAGASQFSGCVSNIDFAITPEPTLCALTGSVCGGAPMLACETNNCVATECEVTGDPTDPTDNCVTNADCEPNTCAAGGMYAYSLFPFGLTRQEWGFGPFGYPETEKEYTFEIKEGAMVTDRCGAITTFGAPSFANNTKTTVLTRPFAFATANTFVPNTGDTIPANRKITVTFNAPLKHTAAFTPDVDTSLITVSPQPKVGDPAATPPVPVADITNASMVRYPPTGAENALFLRGHYQPSTEYTVTFKAGLKYLDNYNKEIAVTADKVITFKTQAIAISASSPANGAVVTKTTPTSATNITFSFNQSMDRSTWGADDIDFIGTPTTLTFGTGSSATSTTPNCTISSQQCLLRVSGVFTPGSYTIRLKAGAAIKDVLGNDYTQAADRTINFTVQEATPAPVIPCLGS